MIINKKFIFSLDIKKLPISNKFSNLLKKKIKFKLITYLKVMIIKFCLRQMLKSRIILKYSKKQESKNY